MGLPQLKYNPGIRGDQELIDGFVVRHHHLELILEVLRENTAASNQHLLVVGPRGSGKTTLVRRVAAEIRRVPDLKANWYPIVFAEESYLISSPGEFWLEALFHLADQTQDDRWSRAYQELREERDEARLRQRTLAQLMDFAAETEKRILMIVENMNMLLGEQIKGSGDWDLRHTLLNEPRVMLLGTATSRFEGIERIDKAWFELFSIHQLQPLDTKECEALWQAVIGEDPPTSRLRPMHILTGGNPRLLKMLAEFAAGTSFEELMSQLVQLIDDHTEYFKSYLDHLAPLERKVFVALLDLWDPSSSQEVARAARLSVSKTSSLLSRLGNKGSIEIVEQRGRLNIYQASERLFNIYYLMRRRRGQAKRVLAVVIFMIHFYREELTAVIRQMVTETEWSDALNASRPAIRAAASSEAAAKLATELLISVAAAGHAEEALDKLIRSEGAEALEPLAVGLRILLGENPTKAREILEVGRDVAQQIRDLQKADKKLA
ncbi:MAG: AAA family ATPase [bacterium]|nr:AAA family ATPase [bacterium]